MHRFLFLSLSRQTSENTAIYCLSQHDWKLDIATDYFFQNPDRYSRDSKSPVDRKKVEALFNKLVLRGSPTRPPHLCLPPMPRDRDRISPLKPFHRYKDPQEDDKMTAEGVMRFLEDLSLNAESQVVLIIAWKFKAATQCEFTKEEFVNGMTEVGCDSVDRLKLKVTVSLNSGRLDLPRRLAGI